MFFVVKNLFDTKITPLGRIYYKSNIVETINKSSSSEKLLSERFSLLSFGLIFFCVALTKIEVTSDELFALNLGNYFFEQGIYSSTKYHPLVPLLLAGLETLTGDNLLSLQILFTVSGSFLGLAIHKILLAIKKGNKNLRLQLIFIALLPGLLFLGLYSATMVPYLCLSFWSIFFLIRYLEDNSFLSLLSLTILVGLAYLCRIDGLILAFLSMILLIYHALVNKERFEFNHVIWFLISFLIIIAPWHIYLLKNNLIMSSIISSGWESTVWTEGPAKYLFYYKEKGETFSLNLHLVKPLVNNIVMFSEYLGSVRLFPIIFWPFIGFALLNYRFKTTNLPILFPLFTCLAYLLFYVEIRYLIFLVPTLGILSVLGIDELENKFSLNRKVIYLPLVIFLLLLDLGYMLYGNRLYNDIVF